MKKTLFFLTIFVVFGMVGCTARSTELAQQSNIRSTAVLDGVHETSIKALSRETYETAALSIENKVLKYGSKMTEEDRQLLVAMMTEMREDLKVFAKKRDSIVGYVQDWERAQALKAVSVDAKLFSEQGILNYIGDRLSDDSQKFFNAWDEASKTFKNPNKNSKPTEQ